MTEIGSTLAREEAAFIPAKMMRAQYIEHAYNWVYRGVPSQGPTIVLFDSALSRSLAVLERFTEGYKGTIICDGYSAYGKLQDVTFANC